MSATYDWWVQAAGRLRRALPSDPLVLESWRRSDLAGVPADRGATLHRVSDDDLAGRQAANATLIELAAPHLHWLSGSLGDRPHVAFLVDPDGIILHTEGDSTLIERFALSPGFDWSEQRMGTNGAGTALAAGRPVAVVGSDHWSEPWKDATCLGAPVFDPSGRLVGAIDISSDVRPGDAERLVIAAHIAYTITLELARRAAEVENRIKEEALAALNTELSQRAESHETLRQWTETLTAILDAAPAAIFVTHDPEARTMTGNRLAADVVGRSPGANVSMSAPAGEGPSGIRVLHDGREVPPGELPVQIAIGRGTDVRDYEFDLAYPDGALRTFFGNAVALRDANGAVRGAVGAFVELTERKQAERALARSLEATEKREEEIRSLYDHAPIGLGVLDRKGRFLRANQRLADINGVSVADHLGRTFREVVPVLADQGDAILHRVLDGEAVSDIVLHGELPSRPGELRWWSEHWFPVRDERGAVVAATVAVEEITHLKRTEDELRQTVRVKDEFFATLSHELRTPLNAIVGWADMLRRGEFTSDTQRKGIEAIHRAARAEMALVEEILDTSRMIAGKLQLNRVATDLVAVLHAAVDVIRPVAEAKHVTVTLDATGTLVSSGDPDRLQQVFWNLLSNAVKFTQSGGRVDVVARRADLQFEVTIRDSGIGMPPDFIPYAFERFRQRDSTTAHRHRGLGLGLAIVRHLVELHGGTVSAHSAGEGQGSEFTVRLPVHAVLEPVDAPEPEPRHRPEAADDSPDIHDGALLGRRVLVVDDNEDARLVIEATLERCGATVVTAASAADALTSIEEHRPDVVISDIAMPGTDGYEFMRRVRALSAERGGGIPAIALTAYARPEDRVAALEAGFHCHVVKPADAAELIALVRGLLGEPS